MDAPFPTVSVILAVRHPIAQVRACMEGLQSQVYTGPWVELILVDYGAPPETAQLVRAHGGLTVPPPCHLGQALDLGAANARGEVLVFLRADCMPSRHWLSVLLEPLVEGADDTAIGGWICRQTAAPARLAALEWAQSLHEWQTLDKRRAVDSGGLAIHRERWEKVPDAQPDILGDDGADRDLAARLYQARARIALAPAALCERRFAASWREETTRQFLLAYDTATMVWRQGLSALRFCHRPGTAKVQSALVLLALCNFLLLRIATPDVYFLANLIVFLLFMATSGGLINQARQTMPDLLPWVPLVILARAAVALGGFTWGVLNQLVNGPVKERKPREDKE